MSRDDRMVHATLASGDLIVRRNRAGKWYRESEGVRSAISFALAVELACHAGSEVHFGRPGGTAFDAKVRAARKEF